MERRNWTVQGDGYREAGPGFYDVAALAGEIRRGSSQLAVAVTVRDVQDLERQIDPSDLRPRDVGSAEPVSVLGIPIRTNQYLPEWAAAVEYRSGAIGVLDLRTGRWAVPPKHPPSF